MFSDRTLLIVGSFYLVSMHSGYIKCNLYRASWVSWVHYRLRSAVLHDTNIGSAVRLHTAVWQWWSNDWPLVITGITITEESTCAQRALWTSRAVGYVMQVAYLFIEMHHGFERRALCERVNIISWHESVTTNSLIIIDAEESLSPRSWSTPTNRWNAQSAVFQYCFNLDRIRSQRSTGAKIDQCEHSVEFDWLSNSTSLSNSNWPSFWLLL